MKPYRIFLASSSTLKTEKDAFLAEINRLNDEFVNRGVFLQLDIWEKFDAANDPNRKQDFYNNYIAKADVFVVAYHGELGAFTLEEYQNAEELFKTKGKPKIYLFKCIKPLDFIPRPESIVALEDLEKVWYDRPKAQWPWEYKEPSDFIHKITIDLEARFKNEDDKEFVFKTNVLLEQGQAAVPQKFKGREQELKAIKQKLDDGGRLIVLKGEGGIGKMEDS